jgi:hypothetical protein
MSIPFPAAKSLSVHAGILTMVVVTPSSSRASGEIPAYGSLETGSTAMKLKHSQFGDLELINWSRPGELIADDSLRLTFSYEAVP